MSLGEHTVEIKVKNTQLVPKYLFLNVKRLTHVTIPSCVTKIEECAFEGCSNLAELTIPPNVTTISSGAFNKCTSLTELIIPNTVTSCTCSFASCSNLVSLNLPDSMTRLNGQCFSQCTKLKRINSNVDGVYNIPNVSSLGLSAFNSCKEAVDITISNNATFTDGHVFAGCSKLKRINSNIDGVYNIPSIITILYENTFGGCTQLEAIYMSDNITKIEGSCFSQCTKLKRINSNVDGVYNIPSATTYIGNMCFRSTLVENVSIPNGLITLGYSAFSGCSHLTDIILPEGVTTININTFDSCSSMTIAELPSTITSIGKDAFNRCSNMSSLILKAITPPTLGSNVFAGNNCIIYVPASSVSTY